MKKMVDGVVVDMTPEEIAEREADEAASVRVPTLADYQAAIQDHVDGVARSKQYNDGAALAGYINSTVEPWAAEASVFIAWRDAVWVFVYGELDKVMNGQREQPSVAEFIGELPEVSWPE